MPLRAKDRRPELAAQAQHLREVLHQIAGTLAELPVKADEHAAVRLARLLRTSPPAVTVGQRRVMRVLERELSAELAAVLSRLDGLSRQ